MLESQAIPEHKGYVGAMLAPMGLDPGAEQASKGKTRTPTRHGDGEGSTDREGIDMRACPVRRGIGRGRLEERNGQSGETRAGARIKPRRRR